MKNLLNALARRAVRIVAPKSITLRNRAYSQEGEDLILVRHFGWRGDGFYVDVGAHHPLRFSNTQLLYERGWRGINIDAMPGSMVPFRRYRSRDVNLEMGVGEEKGQLDFHVFNEPALNTFDPAAAREATKLSPLAKVVPVEVMPLSDILARYVPEGKTIDLLSVDVEGRDLQVLRSNDWGRFKPEVIVAESLRSELSEISSDPIALFLTSKGYRPFAKTVNSIIFKRDTAYADV